MMAGDGRGMPPGSHAELSANTKTKNVLAGESIVIEIRDHVRSQNKF
jgi:hypothetical protein